MKPARRSLLTVALVLGLASSAAFAPPAAARSTAPGDKAVPFLTGRVNDTAGMLSSAARAKLEQELAAFEKRTGHQVAILTIDSLDGEPLEDYSMRVVETWKLGRKGKDDGVLFLIAKNDHKMRIEVGYGLEPQLTDAQAGRILDRIVRPRFQAGNFDAGVEDGVNAILASIEGKAVAMPPKAGSSGSPVGTAFGVLIFLVIIGTFGLTALFSRGCSAWFLYLFLTPFLFSFPASFSGRTPVGGITVGLWLVAFPLFRLWLAKSKLGKKLQKASPYWTSKKGGHWGGGFFGGGGFSGGGFSGGGFSGGGGSFGGGGASGGW